MLNAMTPPQGPYQQPNNPAGNTILLAQQRDSSSSSSTVPTPSENSSSPVSSSASTSSSSSTSTGSSTSSPSNLLSTPTSDQKAITSQQMGATSERLKGGDEVAPVRAQEFLSAKTGDIQQHQDNGQQSADQAERLTPALSEASDKRSSAQPDFHQNNATSTSQENSSKEQVESSPARVSDHASAYPQAPPTALATHQHQPAHSPAGFHPQYHHHQQSQQQQNHHHHQHNTSNHHKPTGHHSQPYRSSRFNNHISQQQQQLQHHQHSNHNTQNSHNSIKSSTTSANSGSFSAIRSRNHRGHNNGRHKNNHHQNHHQSHNHHHHQQQQSALLTNGGLNNREAQQTFPAPYSTAAAATATASPDASLSGPDTGAKNTATSISSHSAAPTPAGPPHYVEMHVFAGECVAFQLMDGQEQIITGPATMTMVSQQESPPVPIPVQVPPGHTIHQVADENGTLRHIIFSVLNCENGDHMNSNVIDFPHETFRVDSLGELVSTNNPAGIDGDASAGDHQASPPASKFSSTSYDKIDHYRQDTFHMGPSNTEDSRGAPNYKHTKSSYKHANSRHVSNHLAREKNADFERDRRLVREQSNYDMIGHNLSGPGMMSVAGAEVGSEMDASMMVNFGQMMAPSLDDQMYGYPNCACCCCYCDPNAEAAAAVVATNQPLNSPTQMSTGPMIGQQDVIMMQQIEPQTLPQLGPAPQHDTRLTGSFRNTRAATNGNSMAYQNHHPANSMNNSGHYQQQAFSHHPAPQPTHSAKSASNVNSTKVHANKASRSTGQSKQVHGNKSHQSNYDRHHGTHNHHDSHPAQNSVASSGHIQAQQLTMKDTVRETSKEAPSLKLSSAKQLVAQNNQQSASQDDRSASEEKAPALIAASTAFRSPSAITSSTQPTIVASPSAKRENKKVRDPTPTSSVKVENQDTEPEAIPINKKLNYPASDKSTNPRPVAIPSPVPAASEICAKQALPAPASSSSSSSSSSPNRQLSLSRQSLSAVRSSHHKNQESTLVNKKSHPSDEATKVTTTTTAPNHQVRPQPNSATQRTASATVTNKNDVTREGTSPVSSSVTKITKQSAKVSQADSASHQQQQQQQHSKQKQVETGKRAEDTVISSQQEPPRRGKQKKHHNHNHNQSTKAMSVLKQCGSKLATSTGRVVQNLLSSCSDAKFAGLLLIIFTMFATFLAIIIDYYIVAPVTE